MTNTVTLPQSVFKRLEKNRLDYEEWFLKQVDAGLAEMNAGKGISDEEFWKRIGAWNCPS